MAAVPLLEAAAAIGSRLDRHDAPEPWSPLTRREFEVTCLVARGLTNREIAEELRITPRTAGSHLEHIRAKLGVGRRSEIAAWATAIEEGPPRPRRGEPEQGARPGGRHRLPLGHPARGDGPLDELGVGARPGRRG